MSPFSKNILLFVLFWVLSSFASARDLHQEYESASFTLGTKKITAFIADTDEKRRLGLMNVDRLEEHQGMLFVFEEEQVLSFWMKNTRIPLNIGFFNVRGELVDTQDMKVPSVIEDRPVSYQSRVPAIFALEMNAGWFQKNKVLKGMRLRAASTVNSQLFKKIEAKHYPPRQ